MQTRPSVTFANFRDWKQGEYGENTPEWEVLQSHLLLPISQEADDSLTERDNLVEDFRVDDAELKSLTGSFCTFLGGWSDAEWSSGPGWLHYLLACFSSGQSSREKSSKLFYNHRCKGYWLLSYVGAGMIVVYVKHEQSSHCFRDLLKMGTRYSAGAVRS